MLNGRVLAIGHGSHSGEELLQRLTQAGFRFVVDVRSTPYSSFQPDFSHDAREHFLRGHQLRHVFMEVMAQVANGQRSLFAERFVSRKAYRQGGAVFADRNDRRVRLYGGQLCTRPPGRQG